MTTTTTARFIPAPSPIFAFFDRIVAMLERGQRKAQIRDELELMSPRELADLGLSTSDINDVVNGTYRRD